MFARLYLVPHQGVRHCTIDHSHPCANKARATKVMHARANTTFLTCAQSPEPLSDAQAIQSSEGVRARRLDCTTMSEYLVRYPERNMVLPSPTL